MATVRYSSNNSGGSWWLTDQNWLDLETAGWDVSWLRDQERRWSDDGERFLGALATEATRTGLSLGEAIEEWERVTGQSSNDLGCSCCGSPHYFSSENESYSPEFPSQGERYGY